MKRALVPAAIALLASGLLAGCGDGDDGATNAAGTAADDTAGGGMMDDDGHTMSDDGHVMSGEQMATAPVAEGAREIEVKATSFSFDPSDIEVGVGEDVAIVLTAKDIPHDFTIDELNTHVAAGARKTEKGGLRADEAGTYTFYCSVPGHRSAGMEGMLVAT